MAGTDMMWMRNDLSRFSEKWAAMTGLKNIRVCSKDGLQIKLHEDKANSVLITGFHLTLMTKWRQRSECLWRETVWSEPSHLSARSKLKKVKKTYNTHFHYTFSLRTKTGTTQDFIESFEKIGKSIECNTEPAELNRIPFDWGGPWYFHKSLSKRVWELLLE